MYEDPIVTEVRRAGKELVEQADGDLHKFFENLRKAQKKYSERLVNKVPRQPLEFLHTDQ